MTTQAGASSQNRDDDMDTTTQKPPTSGAPRQKTPRELMLEGLESKVEAARTADEEYFLKTGGARAAAMAAELRARAESDDPSDEDTTTGAENADASTQHAPVAVVPADPLAEHVIVQNGKPMLKLKVDGKETMIDLDAARTTLQKHTAAEVRLQQAAEAKRSLDTREIQLQAREQALNEREQKLRSQPPPKADADDPVLLESAKELVTTIMSDPEDKAVQKVAKILGRVRTPTAAPVNEEAIVEKAATVAEQRTAAKQRQQDTVTGYKQFEMDYPEIAKDPRLFTVADQMSDQLTQEHPEWTPSQVMAEAGKRTRDWVAEMTGRPATPTPQPTNDRQVRKQNLRPMPPARSVRVDPRPAEAPAETPQSVMAEIRKARGQA